MFFRKHRCTALALKYRLKIKLGYSNRGAIFGVSLKVNAKCTGKYNNFEMQLSILEIFT